MRKYFLPTVISFFFFLILNSEIYLRKISTQTLPLDVLRSL